MILAPDDTDRDEFLEKISLVKSLGVRASILPRIFEVVGTAVEFDTLNGLTALGIRLFGLTRRRGPSSARGTSSGQIIALLLLSRLIVVIVIAIRAPQDLRRPANHGAGSVACHSTNCRS